MAIARAPVLHPYYASRSSRNCGGDTMQTLLQDEVASCSLKANLQSPCSNKEGRKKNRFCLQGRNLFKQVRLSTSHWITSGVVCQPQFSLTPTASSEEGPTVNGSCCTKPEDQWLEVSARYEKHFKGGVEGTNLAQALHEGARMFQLAIEEQESLTRGSWLVKQWIDFDKKAWIKLLSYQAAVYALLQAAIEIAVRGEGRDRDAHVFVQRSLSHQCLPLEASIREHLSSRDPAAIEWLWSQQLPYAVSNFVNLLEKCPCFAAVTSPSWESALSPSKASDVGLVTLAISCSGAALKLGAATLSCPPFSATLHEEIGRLMHLLADLVKMDDVYAFCSSLELRREFLVYFGSRASAAVCNQNRRGERAFWVNLAQQLLRGAIIREGVRSRLNFHDVTEALEKNLAIFGFFAALGRRTRSFISRKGVSKPHESLVSLLRYFEGGSVLFYPKFANLTIYQLFIEVVCEELEWLPFYSNEELSTPRLDAKEKGIQKLSKVEGEAISKALEVCSNWVEAFMNHNDWLDQSSGIQASKFLLNSELRLQRCYGLLNPMDNTRDDISRGCVRELATSIDKKSKENMFRSHERNAIVDDLGWNASYNEPSWIWIEKKQEEKKRIRKESSMISKAEIPLDGRSFEDMETQFRLFDESVEKALCKLESLLHETSGTERCTTSRMDLERIRFLKREAEALEASLKEKAITKKEGAIRKQEDIFMGQASAIVLEDQITSLSEEASGPNDEAKDIEALRKELLELESRIRGSVSASAGDNNLSDEDIILGMEASSSSANTIEMELEGRSYGAVFSKSIEKLKDASVDVWRGTQLLGTDVAVAMGLLRRKILGQELTEREKKVLKRTLTDVASVIPIGVLMLLPVTAVGHAAMLAAIQKYVPALIPSAYGRERLDMLRQLEQVRHMEIETCNIEHEASSPPTTSKKGKQLLKSTEKAT
ncbi:hypothetical protein O6H91_07G000700 [Diphasiastrum complanatum]|uniref:Uncharacterized protein n=1 Tax=Diphasiastrum complanatum TaxID=34168 RepID=A0ACC2D1J3_DIPCM|nr:hypothetical protein O6H91_07G000700 [Diphasiastrum complanatum]